ncbi:hypothetical protein HRI_000068000 [Hibiscus trionum]|uniref:RRM domain-containing protein n=1 Tax=Hibiscus trionum TaxID=183268 RepID=A0A9W7GRZ6_HIBTR|nr:hypothetical protein HRI_000068000 [Hibiscus trionum]
MSENPKFDEKEDDHMERPSSIGIKRRLGFAIFIDNVSKRIHYETLKEAFQAYGCVFDVYIAYKSLKRKDKPTTFSFVRFGTEIEARSVVERSNGRLMDGKQIRVFIAKRR